MKKLVYPLVLLTVASLCSCAHMPTAARSSDSAKQTSTSTLTGTALPPLVNTILAQSKAAMGGAAWDQIHSLSMKGTVELGTLSGSITSLLDLSTGRWVGHAKVGPIELASGFNGNVKWTKGSNGEVTVDKPPKASDVTDTYRKEYGWWYPQRWPAKIELVGAQSSQSKTFEVLRITPQGGNPFEMWIDAQTHFISRFVGDDSRGTSATTTMLEDYRAVHGVELPFRTRNINNTTQRQQLTQLQSVAVNVPANASIFAIPRQHSDISIIGGAKDVTIPFEPTDGYINVQVAIGNHPLRFIVDTGGYDILSTQAARAVGTKGEGAVAAAGLGSKQVDQSYTKVKEMTLGNSVQFRNQTFAIQPMHDADGALGTSAFNAHVVRIDFGNHKLTFIQPGDFNPAEAGTPLPIKLIGGSPAVQASIGGVPGWFILDTGANGLVTLNTPFSTENDLYARFKAAPAAPAGHGYNGQIVARLAHNENLVLGPFHGMLPEVTLSTATTGAAALKHVAGYIGNGVLKHLTVTFDYAHKTVYLKPNNS